MTETSANSLSFVFLLLAAVVFFIIVCGVLLRLFYRRATKDLALVRTGFLGEKIVIDGGMLVIPVLHEVTRIPMTSLTLRLNMTNESALLTQDHLRLDAIVEFFMRIKPERGYVSNAARSFGQMADNDDMLKQFLEGRMASSLRSAAAAMSMEAIHQNREKFIENVRFILDRMVQPHGLVSDSIAVVDLDQTSLAYFDASNAFDAKGLTTLTELIEGLRLQRNQIEQQANIDIKQQNLTAHKHVLAIELQSEAAKIAQEEELEAKKSAQRAQIAVERAKSEREIEQAAAAAKQAKALTIAAEEQIATAREKEIAERESMKQIIDSKTQAQITEIGNQAKAQHYQTEAAGHKLLNEADNILSDAARRARLQEQLIAKLEDIIREQVKPIEKIEGIKILHIDGLTQGVGAGGQVAGHSVTDDVINTALRYRVQAPMLDHLMQDLGLGPVTVGKLNDVLRDAKDLDQLAKSQHKAKSEPPKTA